MIISIIMMVISYYGLYELSERYKNRSYFDAIFKILSDTSNNTNSNGHVDNGHVDNGHVGSHNIVYDESLNDDDSANNNIHNVLLLKV